MRKMTQFIMKKNQPKKNAVSIFLFLIFFMSASLFGKINLSRSADESKFPAIAINSKGEIMVVWLEWSGDNYYRIYKDGQWSSVKNCGIARQRAWTNELAVDSQGKFHLTFADGYSSNTRDIVYSYFTDSGWATPEKIYASPYNSAWNKMDIDPNDNVHVVWYHSHIPKTEGTYNSDVVWMKKPKNGIWPTTYENISRQRYTESICSAMAVHNSNVYATWMEGSPQKYPWRLTFSERVGGKWSTPLQISKLGYYPDMVTDNSGNVHVAFSRRGGNFYAISRIGGMWTGEQVISNGFAPLQFGEIQQKDNVVVAAWVQGQDGNWEIYGSSKLPGGNWGIPVKIANSPGGDDGNKHIHFVIDNNNCAHLVWQEMGVGGQNDIFYEQYSLDTPKDATFIEVDSSYLSFHTNDGLSSPGPQTFKARASGQGSITYSVSSNKNWISVAPLQGASSGEWVAHTVSIDSSALSDGSYYGSITLTDPGAYNSPTEVTVSLVVGEDTGGGGGGGGATYIQVDKTNIEFSMTEGKNPPPEYFSLRAAGENSLSYSISTNMPWLTTSQTKGTATSEWDTISVSVDMKDRAPGVFKGRIDIFPAGSNSKTAIYVTVKLEKRNSPHIQINRSNINFWGYAHSNDPPSDIFKIKNSGQGKLNYKITPSKNWIKVSPSQGVSAGEEHPIVVSADSLSLGVSVYQATLKITADGAMNSPQIISVKFDVQKPPHPYPPANIKVRKINHEGLVIQSYKNEISWTKNSQNQDLFDIVSYRIFRREKSNPYYSYIDEVRATTFIYYDASFATKEERNKYTYTVSAVDSTGKESPKAVVMMDDNLIDSLMSNKKETSGDKILKDRIKSP
jgi:hypothetical protein